MEKKILDKVLEVVKDNLPEANWKMIKKLVEDYEDVKSENQLLKKNSEEDRKTISDLKKHIDKLESLKMDRDKVDNWLKDLEEKKRQSEIDKLTMELEMEKKFSDNINWFVSNLTRNVEYRKNIFGNKTVREWWYDYQTPYNHDETLFAQ